ncbi:hypothetical protein Clacol_007447 [Clathrus columnatus]|uniref:Uncharacterized protein n=1 Tax=Clathrus columnatus TaxID=1419009 RepID=A0AAV5AJT1_9AGAM|nr:hypothetical protein Clacol_007447 [Clathrus columnatus]
MNRHPLPLINTISSSTSTGRERRPSSAIFIGSGAGGFYPSNSASSISSPLPPLTLASPSTPASSSLSSVSPVSPANSIATSVSQSHSQLPSPPSTTAGSTGSDRNEGNIGTRRSAAGHQKSLSTSSTSTASSLSLSSVNNKLGNQAPLISNRDRDGEDEDEDLDNGRFDEDLDQDQDHTARHHAQSFGGRRVNTNLDHDLTTKLLNSGSETERERDRSGSLYPSRTQTRVRTPDHPPPDSNNNSNKTNPTGDNDDDATPPASSRRTIRNGGNSPRKQVTTFSVIGSGKRSRTVSILERDKEDTIMSGPGPGPSTLTNRRARAPLPREFRSDRMSVSTSGEFDVRSIDIDDSPQQNSTHPPASPRRSRNSKTWNRNNKRSHRLSLGDELPRADHERDAQFTHSTTRLYGGGRQSVRQSGSAESALARERGSLRELELGNTPERDVGATALMRRSTVAGAGHARNQNNNTAAPMSPSRRRGAREDEGNQTTTRYSTTIRRNIDGAPTPQVRATTSMAVFRDRDDSPLSAITSRRTLRSSLLDIERDREREKDRERERPPSTLRFTPLSEPQWRGSSPFVQTQQPSTSSSSADHTNLLLDALQVFESHLSKPLPPSDSSLASIFPDLQTHATTLVQSAHTLNELLRTLTSRALESQIEAEIGDIPAQVDAGEIWRIVGAEYREGLRVSDDLVRVVTALLIVFGRVLRDVAKRTASTTSDRERERDRGESPDVGGGSSSVISGGTGGSSGARSTRSRHSLDGALRVRPIRRSTGMDGISLPPHSLAESRRSMEIASSPLLSGRASVELSTRIQEDRERITNRRSMDGVVGNGYTSHTHSSSAETLKRERAALDLSRPATSLSFVRRGRVDQEDEGEETSRDTTRLRSRELDRELDRRTTSTLDSRLSLRRTFMPRLRDNIPAALRSGTNNTNPSSPRMDETATQTPSHLSLSQAHLHLLAQVQAQDSPTPAPRAAPPSLPIVDSKKLAIPPPLPSLPSESLLERREDSSLFNNLPLPTSTLPSNSSSLSRPGSALGSIRRRPKFSNTSITTVRGGSASGSAVPGPILSPSTPVTTTALSNSEVEIKGDAGARRNVNANGITVSGGSMRNRSGTLSLRDLQERDRIMRERLGANANGADRGAESRERNAESTNTLRKRAISSASASASGSGSGNGSIISGSGSASQSREDLTLGSSTSSTSISSSNPSRTRTLRSRDRPRMSLDDVEFDRNGVSRSAHVREVSSPAALGFEYEYGRD